MVPAASAGRIPGEPVLAWVLAWRAWVSAREISRAVGGASRRTASVEIRPPPIAATPAGRSAYASDIAIRCRPLHAGPRLA